jgi:hypothetical protein
MGWVHARASVAAIYLADSNEYPPNMFTVRILTTEGVEWFAAVQTGTRRTRANRPSIIKSHLQLGRADIFPRVAPAAVTAEIRANCKSRVPGGDSRASRKVVSPCQWLPDR